MIRLELTVYSTKIYLELIGSRMRIYLGLIVSRISINTTDLIYVGRKLICIVDIS